MCVSSTITFARENENSRPNILFIIADDASCDSFGAYGARPPGA